MLGIIINEEKLRSEKRQMNTYRMAIVGLGATGTVLAAALLRKDPRTILVGRSHGMGKTLVKDGIRVSGEISYFVPVENYCGSIRDLGKYSPDLILISTHCMSMTSNCMSGRSGCS